MNEGQKKRKYLLKSPVRVARLSRLLAKAIDIFIVLILSIFFYPLGIILSVIYIGLADSIQSGQSVGKKFIGFRVISLEDGSPCSVKQSFIRNLPIIVPLVVSIVPLWGWVLGPLIGLPFMGLEIYLLFKLDSGHRLGDVMADTTVMANDDTKELAEQKKNSSWFESQDTSSTSL